MTTEPLKGPLMKRLLTAIAAAVFLIYPCVCAGDYVIHLKDGGRILVDKYSEEGNTIRVKNYGGMMGISRALVSRIEEVKTETTPEVKRTSGEKSPEGTKEEEKSEKEKPAEISEEGKKQAEQEKTGVYGRKNPDHAGNGLGNHRFKDAKARETIKSKKTRMEQSISLQKKFADLEKRSWQHMAGTCRIGGATEHKTPDSYEFGSFHSLQIIREIFVLQCTVKIDGSCIFYVHFAALNSAVKGRAVFYVN